MIIMKFGGSSRRDPEDVARLVPALHEERIERALGDGPVSRVQ